MLSKAKKLYQAARDHAGFRRYFKNTSWLFGGQMFRMVIGLFVYAFQVVTLPPVVTSLNLDYIKLLKIDKY